MGIFEWLDNVSKRKNIRGLLKKVEYELHVNSVTAPRVNSNDSKQVHLWCCEQKRLKDEVKELRDKLKEMC